MRTLLEGRIGSVNPFATDPRALAFLPRGPYPHLSESKATPSGSKVTMSYGYVSWRWIIPLDRMVMLDDRGGDGEVIVTFGSLPGGAPVVASRVTTPNRRCAVTVQHKIPPRVDESTGVRSQASAGVGPWLFGISGAIATFLGLFVFVAGDDQSIGIGGDLSWRVGDIHVAWAVGLLLGGIALLAVMGRMLMTRRGVTSTARRVSTSRTDLMWHAVIFLVVNAFLWLQDIVTGGGLEYAYFATIPWAVGLALHAATYYIDRSKGAGGG